MQATPSIRKTGVALFLCGIFFLSFFGYSKLYDEYGLRKPFPYESSSSYLKNELRACFATRNFQQNVWRSSCYQALGTYVMEHFAVTDALTALAQVQSEPDIKPYCHSFGHVIGQKQYTKTGNLGETFLACSSSIACGEGCYHGAMEAYLHEYGSEVTPHIMQNACNEKDMHNRVEYLACVHGLGHAAMLVENSNLYKALGKCDYLTDTFDRDNCYSGAFMEDTFTFGSTEQPTSLINPSDPEFPCGQIAEKYKNQCYASRATFLLQRSSNDYGLVSKYCDHIPKQYKVECYGSFGGQAVLVNSDPVYIANVCAGVAEKESRDRCMLRAATFKGYEKAGAAKPYRLLCEATPKEDQPTCYSIVGFDLGRWFPGKRAEKCLEVAPSNSAEYEYCAGTKRP